MSAPGAQAPPASGVAPSEPDPTGSDPVADVRPADGAVPLMGIGPAATLLGVSERALRYYQQIGLLTPSGRTPGGMRRYAPADLDRVRRIRELQELLGFNLEEIRPILADEDRLAVLRAEYHDPATTDERRRALLAEGVTLREGLRATVVAKLGRLQDFLADLDSTIDRNRRRLHATSPDARQPGDTGAARLPQA